MRTRVFSTFIFMLLAILGVGGCAERTPQATLAVERMSWDSLRVDLQVAVPSRLGEARLAEPDSLLIHLFSAAYDTLFAGPGPLIVFEDARRGDREQMMLEACAWVEGAPTCEQRAVEASPKRLRADAAIAYPERGDYEHGRYDLDLEAERQAFGSEAWEPIPLGERYDAYLEAVVTGTGMDAVRVPIKRLNGPFDLTHYDRRGDLKYYVRSQLMDAPEVTVQFDLYGGLGQQPVRLASIEKQVRRKTRSERAVEVAHYLEGATQQLIDRLGHFDRARVYVDDWEFQTATGRYRVEVEIVGRGPRYRRTRMKATLTIGEQGDRPVFEVEEADRRTRERWEEAFERPLVNLDDVAPPTDERLDPDAEGAPSGTDEADREPPRVGRLGW